MQRKSVLFPSLMIAIAIAVGAIRMEAQIRIDSGVVRELLLVVANPGLPEWGGINASRSVTRCIIQH